MSHSNCPLSGLEPGSSDVGNDPSTNCATTAASLTLRTIFLMLKKDSRRLLTKSYFEECKSFDYRRQLTGFELMTI